MRFQINRQLNSLQGKPDKQSVQFKNSEKNWETVEGDVDALLGAISQGHAFRLCVKQGGNSKDDLSEVWGIAIDIDKGAFSIQKTLSSSLLRGISYIFYISASGTLGEDATPHRLLFPFRNPTRPNTDTNTVAERVSQLLHTVYTDCAKHSTFDGGRLWFSTTLENMPSLEYAERPKFIDDLFPTAAYLPSEADGDEAEEPVEVATSVSREALPPLPKKVLKATANGGSKAGDTDVTSLIAQISSLPLESSASGTKKEAKKNTGKSVPERLDLFWSDWVMAGDINSNIEKVAGFYPHYKATTRKTTGKIQYDGGHWEGSLSGKGDHNSTTLTLTQEGNLIYYDRRNGTGSNFIGFLYNAYSYTLSGSIATIKPSAGDLLKFTKERCAAIGIEPPKLTLAPEEVWQAFLADYETKIRYMTKIKAYVVYGKSSLPMASATGANYRDRSREDQSRWDIVTSKELVPVIDAWNAATFGSHCTAKVLKDLKTLAELGTSQVNSLPEFPIDPVLPVRGDLLWDFNSQQLIPASEDFYYWNNSTMPFLQDAKKEAEAKDNFVKLLTLITPEKEHFKIPHVLDWLSLWLAGRAYNSQFSLYFWGEGGAGKSTICEWLASMVGEDIYRTRENELLKPDLRFNTGGLLLTKRLMFDEFKGDNIAKANLPFLKDLIAASKQAVLDGNGSVIPGVYSGGTSIRVEIKYAGTYTGKAQLGVILNGQNLPVVPETDAGWPRRFLFLNFRLAEARTDLFSVIGSSLPYLRSWLLKRDLVACEERLEEYIRSSQTLQANRALLHGNSMMGEFINSYVNLTPGDYPTPFIEVYQAWSDYCDLQKIKPGSIGRFLESLESALKAMGLLPGGAAFVEMKRDPNRNMKKYLMMEIIKH